MQASFRLGILTGLVVLMACSQDVADSLDPRPTPLPSAGLDLSQCPQEGWCWVRGRPLTVGGDSVAGTVFAIGSEGTFLRWDQGRWLSLPVPTARTLVSAWVGGPDEAWAVDAEGSVWQWRDQAWRERPAELKVLRVLGRAGGSVWVLAGGLAGVHGSTSGAVAVPFARDAWGTPVPRHDYCLDGDYVLVGEELWSSGLGCDAQGTVQTVEVRRFEGRSWGLVGAPIQKQGWFPSFEWIDDQLVVRASGTYVFDGTAWTEFLPGLPPTGFNRTFPPVPEGDGWREISWSQCSEQFRLRQEGWCYGLGQIYHFQDGLWSPTLRDPFGQTQAPGLWGQLPVPMWAGSDTLRAWGSGPDQVFRVRQRTGSRLEQYQGGRWTTLDPVVRDLDGSGPDDVWFATDGAPLHYDGRGLSAMPVPREVSTGTVTRVFALAPGVTLAVTDRALLRFEGRWSIHYLPPDRWSVYDVAGTSLDDLWVSLVLWSRPTEAKLVHFDGQRWSEVPLETYGQLTRQVGQTWMYDGTVRPLGLGEAPGVPPPPQFSDFQLSVDARAIWLTTHDQALRYPRP